MKVNKFSAIVACSFFLFSQNSYSDESRWSEEEKIELCKSYIGKLFSKDPSIISHYKTDSHGQVYVRYERASDNTLWQYACSVNEDNIVWSTWLKDTEKWGRWRDEDRASLDARKNASEVVIDIPNYSDKVIVDIE